MTNGGALIRVPLRGAHLASVTRSVALALVLVIGSSDGSAQATVDSNDGLGLDATLLRGIYSQDGAALSAVMHSVNASSNPSFYLAVPVLAVATVSIGDERRDWDPAFRLGLSQLGAAAVVYGLKHTVRRDRPYFAEDDIEIKGRHDHSRSPHLSFPSGHAGLAFAIGTSLSLSYPEWYVVAPAMTWAALVAYSRPWLGVHYPSDVLAGAVIGSGSAILVHLLAPSINGSDDVSVHGARMVPIVVRF